MEGTIIPLGEGESKYRMAIDPDTAQYLLDNMIINRPLSNANIKKMIKDIEHNRWHLTGQPIIIDSNGQMTDGQHRMHAVIKTRATLIFDIQEGVKPESKIFVDSGKIRTKTDRVSMSGIPDANVMTPVIQNINLLDRAGHFHRRGGPDTMDEHEIVNFYHNHQERLTTLHKEMQKYAAGSNMKSVGRNMMMALAFKFKGLSVLGCINFMNSYYKSLNLSVNSPVLILRNRFIDDMKDSRKLTEISKINMVITTWNHIREKKRLYKKDLIEDGSTELKVIL